MMDEGMVELASIKEACAVCVVHAVREGVGYNDQSPVELVGQTYGRNDEFTIHEAVTLFAGTPVCWYHVDDVAKSQGM